uniref:Uncharacterized protein n=1 Tax=Caenorhabditis tropicalis TaxID=1561998 RepID=A0A1I7UEI7_9PELO
MRISGFMEEYTSDGMMDVSLSFKLTITENMRMMSKNTRSSILKTVKLGILKTDLGTEKISISTSFDSVM